MIFDNDGFFGGMFDFDGDGRTDDIEAAMGFQILDEISREDDKDDKQENDHS